MPLSDRKGSKGRSKKKLFRGNQTVRASGEVKTVPTRRQDSVVYTATTSVEEDRRPSVSLQSQTETKTSDATPISRSKRKLDLDSSWPESERKPDKSDDEWETDSEGDFETESRPVEGNIIFLRIFCMPNVCENPLIFALVRS